MAFPIIALLTAAANDANQRSAYRQQVAQEARDAPNRIMRAYASRMGGQPYGQMQAESENRLSALKTQADASRNNQIGALLQAYLSSTGEDKDPEKYGDKYAHELSRNPGEGGFGAGNVMGKAQLDPWDRDPWGDAGY